MDAQIIKSNSEHAKALKRIEELFSAKPGTPEGDELKSLILRVDQYETAAFPISSFTEVDEKALEEMWKKGREAWKDVDSATEWVEKLRGNS